MRVDLKRWVLMAVLALSVTAINDNCIIKDKKLAGNNLPKSGQTYYNDADALASPEFTENQVPNGFFYCLDNRDGHLTTLQFFIQ